MIKIIGGLAQLVQSTWFTPRGSLVRIQYSPQKERSTFVGLFCFKMLSWFRASRFVSGGSLVRIQYSPQKERSTFVGLFCFKMLSWFRASRFVSGGSLVRIQYSPQKERSTFVGLFCLKCSVGSEHPDLHREGYWFESSSSHEKVDS